MEKEQVFIWYEHWSSAVPISFQSYPVSFTLQIKTYKLERSRNLTRSLNFGSYVTLTWFIFCILLYFILGPFSTKLLMITNQIYSLWHQNKTVSVNVLDYGTDFRLEMDQNINVAQGFSRLTFGPDNSLLWKHVLCVVVLAASLQATLVLVALQRCDNQSYL